MVQVFEPKVIASSACLIDIFESIRTGGKETF